MKKGLTKFKIYGKIVSVKGQERDNKSIFNSLATRNNESNNYYHKQSNRRKRRN